MEIKDQVTTDVGYARPRSANSLAKDREGDHTTFIDNIKIHRVESVPRAGMD